MESSRSNRRRRRESTSSASSSSSSSTSTSYGGLATRTLQNPSVERPPNSEDQPAASSPTDWLFPPIRDSQDRPPHSYFALRRPSTATTTTTTTTTTSNPRSSRRSLATTTMASTSADLSSSTSDSTTSSTPSSSSAVSDRLYRHIDPSFGENPSKRRRTLGRMGGQVDPVKLPLVIVDPDSHNVEGDSDRRNTIHNILNDDNSSYTFPQKPHGTPTVLRFTLPGTEPHTFTLSRLIVDGVLASSRHSTRHSPPSFHEGLVFISYSLSTLDKTSSEYALLSPDYEEDDHSDDSDDEEFVPDPPVLREGAEIKASESWGAFEGYEKLVEKRSGRKVDEVEAARAKIFVGKRKTRCEVVFEPELSGVFLELRLYTHRRNAPLKIKYVGAWGNDGARCFPSKIVNNGEFIRV